MQALVPFAEVGSKRVLRQPNPCKGTHNQGFSFSIKSRQAQESHGHTVLSSSLWSSGRVINHNLFLCNRSHSYCNVSSREFSLEALTLAAYNVSNDKTAPACRLWDIKVVLVNILQSEWGGWHWYKSAERMNRKKLQYIYAATSQSNAHSSPKIDTIPSGEFCSWTSHMKTALSISNPIQTWVKTE